MTGRRPVDCPMPSLVTTASSPAVSAVECLHCSWDAHLGSTPTVRRIPSMDPGVTMAAVRVLILRSAGPAAADNRHMHTLLRLALDLDRNAGIPDDPYPRITRISDAALDQLPADDPPSGRGFHVGGIVRPPAPAPVPVPVGVWRRLWRPDAVGVVGAVAILTLSFWFALLVSVVAVRVDTGVWVWPAVDERASTATAIAAGSIVGALVVVAAAPLLARAISRLGDALSARQARRPRRARRGRSAR